jgi:hypothetical protein
VSDFCQILLSNRLQFYFFDFIVFLDITLSEPDICFGIWKRFWSILLIFLFKTSQIISKHFLDFNEICINFLILMYVCCIYWCLRVAFEFFSRPIATRHQYKHQIAFSFNHFLKILSWVWCVPKCRHYSQMVTKFLYSFFTTSSSSIQINFLFFAVPYDKPKIRTNRTDYKQGRFP